MPRHVRTLVLGAGPTGLGAAWRLHERGDTDWLLVEPTTTPGGAASSIMDDHGFRWDMGGHVIHSHFPYFDQVLHAAGIRWHHPTRSAWVSLDGDFVPAPLQQNLDALPTGMADAIYADVTDTSGATPPDLDAWFVSRFGATLTDAFFRPYNTKMWAHPPRLLDHTWTSLRSGSKLANVPPLSPRPAQDNSAFPYPYYGSGDVWARVAAQLPTERLRYGIGAATIDHNGRSVRLTNGEIISYDHLISTMPLDVLLLSLGYTALATALLHSSVHVMGMGFAGPTPPALQGKSYIFEPDPSVAFHRATVLSNYSPAMAPQGHWSVLFEAGTSPFRPIEPGSFMRDAGRALQRWGVTAEPVSVWERYLPRGYPVPFLGRDEMLAPVMDLLERHDIYSRGRFGGWRYESCNQDYSLMQGVEAVDRALDGAVESTYWPNRFAA